MLASHFDSSLGGRRTDSYPSSKPSSAGIAAPLTGITMDSNIFIPWTLLVAEGLTTGDSVFKPSLPALPFRHDVYLKTPSPDLLGLGFHDSQTHRPIGHVPFTLVNAVQHRESRSLSLARGRMGLTQASFSARQMPPFLQYAELFSRYSAMRELPFAMMLSANELWTRSFHELLR
jgi:hypothetical protein